MEHNEQSPLYYGDSGHESSEHALPEIDFRILAECTWSSSLQWGATPLNAFLDSNLHNSQVEVRDQLELRTREIPEALQPIPPEIQEYVHQNFLSRFVGRTMANCDNFSRRLVTGYLGFDKQMLLNKAVWGQASPAELIKVRNLYGMASIELGCLTHPYGNSIEQLDEMRHAVNEAITLFDGEILSGEPVYAVKQADNVQQNGGAPQVFMRDAFLMTRKRDLGTLPDGSVVRERSSFIVRIDEASGFNQRIARSMRKIPLIGDHDWSKFMAIAGKIDKTIPPLLDENNFKIAIPLSTTIYAFNKITGQHIDERDGHIREERIARRHAFLDKDTNSESAFDEHLLIKIPRLIGKKLLDLVKLLG